MFCPPVGPTTPAVLDLLMNEWGYIEVNDLNYKKHMEEAIYEVAMKSEYSWSAFYSSDNFVYVFILKHNQTGLWYAIQDPASAYVDIVTPLWVNDVNVRVLDIEHSRQQRPSGICGKSVLVALKSK